MTSGANLSKCTVEANTIDSFKRSHDGCYMNGERNMVSDLPSGTNPAWMYSVRPLVFLTMSLCTGVLIYRLNVVLFPILRLQDCCLISVTVPRHSFLPRLSQSWPISHRKVRLFFPCSHLLCTASLIGSFMSLIKRVLQNDGILFLSSIPSALYASLTHAGKT